MKGFQGRNGNERLGWGKRQRKEIEVEKRSRKEGKNQESRRQFPKWAGASHFEDCNPLSPQMQRTESVELRQKGWYTVFFPLLPSDSAVSSFNIPVVPYFGKKHHLHSWGILLLALHCANNHEKLAQRSVSIWHDLSTFLTFRKETRRSFKAE